MNLIKKYKNIFLANYSFVYLKGYYFIGMRGHSFPGKVKSNAFRKHKKRLYKIFSKIKTENKEGRVIFISHNSPYKTKLDKLNLKARKKFQEEHAGSKLARKIIEKWQPVIAISRHVHGRRGMQKIKRTICVDPGKARKR